MKVDKTKVGIEESEAVARQQKCAEQLNSNSYRHTQQKALGTK